MGLRTLRTWHITSSNDKYGMSGVREQWCFYFSQSQIDDMLEIGKIYENWLNHELQHSRQSVTYYKRVAICSVLEKVESFDIKEQCRTYRELSKPVNFTTSSGKRISLKLDEDEDW